MATAVITKVAMPRVRVGAIASEGDGRGVGRVRHLHTQVVWVQESVARRRESAKAGEPSRHWHEASAQRKMHECMRRADLALRRS